MSLNLKQKERLSNVLYFRKLWEDFIMIYKYNQITNFKKIWETVIKTNI